VQVTDLAIKGSQEVHYDVEKSFVTFDGRVLRRVLGLWKRACSWRGELKLSSDHFIPETPSLA